MGEAKRSAGCTSRAFLAARGLGDAIRVQGRGSETRSAFRGAGRPRCGGAAFVGIAFQRGAETRSVFRGAGRPRCGGAKFAGIAFKSDHCC